MADEKPPEATERADENSQRYRDAIDKIRSRTDLAAKSLGAVGTAAITAVGYVKLADIYPFGGPDWAPWGIAIGIILMIVAVGMLVSRFAAASEAFPTTPDPEETIKLNHLESSTEKELVRESYKRLAKLNGVETMRAYQARAHRFERIAENADASRAKALLTKADGVKADMRGTQERVAALVIRERARRAVAGWPTWLLVAAFVVGWYSTAVSADALESKRSGDIEVAKTCAEAREKEDLLEAELPEICGKVEEPDASKEEEGEGSPEQSVATGAQKLAEAWGECLKEAEEAKQDASTCAPLARALAAVGG